VRWGGGGGRRSPCSSTGVAASAPGSAEHTAFRWRADARGYGECAGRVGRHVKRDWRIRETVAASRAEKDHDDVESAVADQADLSGPARTSAGWTGPVTDRNMPP